ncbi:MAG: hypothetical protein E7655_08390 [Ruminococcaceae bacterium]|nr:hypothetical protein [Oscillospiraceae bacterium]
MNMNKKLKYGSTAIVFTVVVIALIVLVNAVFSALSQAYYLYTDMTEYNLYTLTDDSRALLDEVDKEITIYFCMPFDKITDSSPTNKQYNHYLNMVYEFAQQYAAEYDNIKLEALDIVKNPSSVERFETSSTSNISQTSVIVASDNDFRTFVLNALFGVSDESGEVLTFNGEQKLTSAILQLAGDRPTALFTVGHGETVGADGSRPAIWNLLENAGYEVGTVDLTREEITEKAQLIVINGPLYDFRGFGDSADEISKLGKFTDTLGSLMVFFSPDTPDLPELEDMLAEWGVKVEDSVIKDYTNSESTDGYKLVADYTTEGLGASLHSTIRQLDSQPKAIIEYARPISIVWPTGEYTTDTIGKRQASPVLTSFDTAQAFGFGSDTASANGPFNLLTITREQRIKNNETYSSYVMVCGTMDFASDDYLYKNSFSNGDILYSAMRAMGKETVPFSLDYKWFEDNSLDITAGQANAWTIVVSVIVPAIVLIVGAVIAIRRKHL